MDNDNIWVERLSSIERILRGSGTATVMPRARTPLPRHPRPRLPNEQHPFDTKERGSFYMLMSRHPTEYLPAHGHPAPKLLTGVKSDDEIRNSFVIGNVFVDKTGLIGLEKAIEVARIPRFYTQGSNQSSARTS